jgi:hypothetical protein
MSAIGKNIKSSYETSMEDYKDIAPKFGISKFEDDLYHEEYNVAEKIIRIKHIIMPNKDEKWRVIIDDKVIFTIDGRKISEENIKYFNTVEGFNFIINLVKKGKLTIKDFMSELKV